MSLKSRVTVPNLDLPLAGGGRFNLAEQKPAAFTMLVVYRGLHCPICKGYLNDLNRKMGDFEQAGVIAVAATSDNAERAEKAKLDWKLDRLPLAYDMPIDIGREWGLSVSKAIGDAEPEVFLEPGLFLVDPDRKLYAASVQTMPFARPNFVEVLQAVQYVVKNGYPARGEA